MCRRSSDCDDDRPAASYSSLGWHGGSMSSLVAGARRRESIVELLEKKWRENVSIRLRSQLSQHHNSQQKPVTSVCSDLPIIVPPAAATTLLLPPSSNMQQTARRASAQLYQGVMQSCRVERLHSPARRHSVVTTCDIRPQSLSGQHSRRASRHLLDHPQSPSTSSTLGRGPRTQDDTDWEAEKTTTLPTRLNHLQDQTTSLLHDSNDLCNDSEPLSASSSADQRPLCTHEEMGWRVSKNATLSQSLHRRDQLQEILQAPGLLDNSKPRSADNNDNWATGSETDEAGSYIDGDDSSDSYNDQASQHDTTSTAVAVITRNCDITCKELVVSDDSSSVDSAPSSDDQPHTSLDSEDCFDEHNTDQTMNKQP